MKEFPVITLCGSLNHNGKELWDLIAHELSLKGTVVLKVDVWGIRDELHKTMLEKKEMLDRLHKQKILMSDSIFVLNSDGYIGPSTQSEIDFAKKHKIPVDYLIVPNKQKSGDEKQA